MRARSLLCLLVVVGLVLAVPSAAAAYQFFPEAKNQLQRDWQALFTKIFWAALVVFVLVEGIILYSIFRFRKRKGGPNEGPHVHGNTKMEIAWTIAPTLVMGWLLMVSVAAMGPTDTDLPNPDFVVNVVGHQFYWEFFYKDGPSPFEGFAGTLRVEEDKWVGLSVTSVDVIHAFNIPELGVMIDATPGRNNYVVFRAEEPGDYFVQCRELCGVSHGIMHAKLEVFAAGSQNLSYGPAAGFAAPATETPAPTNGTGAPGNNTTKPADVTKEVKLVDFEIQPQAEEAEPGNVVQFTIKNEGNADHNLYIGEQYDASAERHGAIEGWTTKTLKPGESATLTIELPETPGYWEWWCDIPGHQQGGMHGSFDTGGTPKGAPAKKPLLPGFELPLVLVAAVGVAFIVARRKK